MDWSPREYLLAFIVTVIVIGAGAWAYVIDERTSAIHTIAESAQRIESVAANTERILLDTQARQATPEAEAFNQDVQRAVEEIHEIRMILCELPDIDSSEFCR